MKINHYYVLIALISLYSLPGLTYAEQLVGWVENVRVVPGDILVKAKLDTGAKISSLGCDCPSTYMKDGKEWVRFSLTGENGMTHTYDRQVLRRVQVKRHFGEKQRRMVVKLSICLGRQYKEVEFTLINRTGLNYLILLGRDFMAGSILVDPGRTFLARPACSRMPARAS